MRRLTGLLIASAAALTIGSRAQAANIVLTIGPEYVPAAVGGTPSVCAAPCHLVSMFWQDLEGTESIQAIQFDIAIIEGGTANLPTLPLPAGGHPDVRAGNGTSASLEGPAPWNLSTTVARSPNAGFQALVVDAADSMLTVASVAASFADGCTGSRTCPNILAAAANHRIYLGAFNATLTGTILEIDNMQGIGALPPEGRCTVQNGECFVPEPFSVILLGAALTGLGFIRRRI